MAALIREAELRDAPAISELWNALIRDTTGTFTTVEKSHEDITMLIRDRSGSFLVAGGDHVQGFVTWGQFRSGPGYAGTVEHSVIVGKSGQGMGRALMLAAQDAVIQQGIHVMIAAISGENPNAVAFHTAMGFEKVGHLPQVGQKSGRWLDLILMQKSLIAP
ncbi:GNAT family N-acetyltransferase [Sulfitobacter sp. SK012]|uniref:GNAT family N-acetyltransferase n=1 Tax=Sulfitobacter sp. SK012 TaxID=1389005 RepID=UPI000E0B2E31|nr:GNAT family N-acetyltransferase [Sulfitobacter sp. SK012]AXI47468.1 GNAT family N-acetyltransferase [Sulfitobacter sp. SK012]